MQAQDSQTISHPVGVWIILILQIVGLAFTISGFILLAQGSSIYTSNQLDAIQNYPFYGWIYDSCGILLNVWFVFALYKMQKQAFRLSIVRLVLTLIGLPVTLFTSLGDVFDPIQFLVGLVVQAIVIAYLSSLNDRGSLT